MNPNTASREVLLEVVRDAAAVGGIGDVTGGGDVTLWAPGGADPGAVGWRPLVPELAAAERASR